MVHRNGARLVEGRLEDVDLRRIRLGSKIVLGVGSGCGPREKSVLDRVSSLLSWID